MKAVRIPKERVGALIGKDGASKRMLQERMQMTIRVDTEGEVFIEDENAKDPVMPLKAVDIIKAIGRDSPPERALRLLGGCRAPWHCPRGQICRIGFSLSGTARRRSIRKRSLIGARCVFMRMGTAWNHVAMDQAIADSGLEQSDISNPRTGIIMGSGRPSTRVVVEAADITRNQRPQARRPVRCAQGHVVDRIGDARQLVQDQGVNYSISSACATSSHCIGNAAE